MTFHQLRFLPWPHIPWPWPTFCRSPRAPGPWWCCRSSSRLHSASWRWSGRSGVSPGLSPPNWKRRNHVKTMWKPKEHDLHMIIKWIQMMGVLWFSLLELLDSLQSQCKVVILANPNPILQHVGVVPWENYIMHVTQMDHIFGELVCSFRTNRWKMDGSELMIPKANGSPSPSFKVAWRAVGPGL